MRPSIPGNYVAKLYILIVIYVLQELDDTVMGSLQPACVFWDFTVEVNGCVAFINLYQSLTYQRLSVFQFFLLTFDTDASRECLLLLLSFFGVISNYLKLTPVTYSNCAFLRNETTGAWDSRGCETLFFNSTMTMCECNHLTDYTVMLTPAIQIPREVNYFT